MGAWRTISVALAANTSAYSAGMDKAGKDTEKFGRDVDQAKKKVDELDQKLGEKREQLGLVVGAATIAGLGFATKAASDLREAQAAANVVFGESADIIDAYATGAAQAIGLSKKEALDATSVFGNLFTQLGVGQGEAAKLSTSMVTLAADFGSFFNEDPTAIIEAQTAAFRGEYDALQKYVPTINAAAVEQQALTETGKANADQLTQQEKALATYTLMMEGAGAAQGDFARSNGSAATEAKKASAELKNSSAEIGEALLPVAAAGAKALGSLARGFSSLPGPAQTAIVGVGGLGAATVLLLPKLVETAQLLGRAGSKAIDFARNLGSSTTAIDGLGSSAAGANAPTGRLLGLLAGAPIPVGIAAGAIGGAALILFDYANRAAIAEQATENLRAEAERTGKSIDETFKGQLAKVLAEVEGGFDVGQSDNLLRKTLEDAGVSADELYQKLQAPKAEYEAFVRDLARDSGLSGSTFGQVSRDLDQMRGASEAAEEKNRKLDDTNKKLGVSTKGAGDAAGEHATEQQKLADAATEAERALNEQLATAREMFDAQRGVTSAEEDYVEAVLAVDEARRGVADAEAEVDNAYRGVADAQRAVADAQEGVADAMRAVEDARKGVAEAERAVVDAQRDAADAAELVTTRTQELADARRAAAGDSDEMRDALEGVVDAEEDVARAQEDSIAAQQALDDARANYGRTLAGLQRDAEGAADAVIAAEIRIRDAQENAATLGQREQERVAEAQARLNKVLSDGSSTAEEVAAAQKDLADAIADLPDADDRARAELAVRDALRDYAEAQERATDAASEAARVEAAGVEGSDEVVAARDGVAAAADREADAQGRLEDAVLNVAGVQEAANQRVEDAQRDLEDAILDRAAADQRVLDAKDGVIEAQDRVRDAVRGVQDAQQRVRDATNGVADANQRVVDAKQGVVDAQQGVAKAVREVRDATLGLALAQFEVGLKTGNSKKEIDLQIGRLGALRDTLAPNDPLRRQLDEYIARLQMTNGKFTATIALNFTDAAGAVIADANAALTAVLQPKSSGGPLGSGGKGLGGKGGGVVNGKPGAPGLPDKGPVPVGFSKLGSTPVGTLPPSTPIAPASPFTTVGLLAPCGGEQIDYEKLADAFRKSNPPPGPIVHIDRVEEGVGLDAVFRQAEFASRGA